MPLKIVIFFSCGSVQTAGQMCSIFPRDPQASEPAVQAPLRLFRSLLSPPGNWIQSTADHGAAAGTKQ